MALDLKTAERLVKFLEMMSSDQDGEALNAARMASKLIKSSGKKWGDVILVRVDNPAPAPAPSPKPPQSHPGQQQSPFGMGGGLGGQFHAAQQAQHAQSQMWNQFNAAAQGQQYRDQYEAYRNEYYPPPSSEPRIDPEIKKRDEKKRGWFLDKD